MDIRQLRYAVRIGETGHLRKAAEAEFIAPSAMSLHVRRLEEELGVELFTRTPAGVTPTLAGQHFITEAATLLSDLDALGQGTRAVGSRRRELVIGFFGGAVNELTHTIFDGFVTGLPDHDLRFVELSLAEQFDGILHAEVDVALMCLPVDDERLSVVPLFDEPRFVAVSQRSALADADELTCADILDEEYAVPVTRVPGWWSSYWALDDVRGEPGRVGARVATVAEALAAVAYSRSVDTVPASTSRRFSSPGVTYRPLRDGGMTTTGLVSRAKNNDAVLARLSQIASTVVAEMIGAVPDARVAAAA